MTKADVMNFKVPVFPLSTQRAIVAGIEAEQALAGASWELIARFEKGIQATLARVWGDGQAWALRETTWRHARGLRQTIIHDSPDR